MGAKAALLVSAGHASSYGCPESLGLGEMTAQSVPCQAGVFVPQRSEAG